MLPMFYHNTRGQRAKSRETNPLRQRNPDPCHATRPNNAPFGDRSFGRYAIMALWSLYFYNIGKEKWGETNISKVVQPIKYNWNRNYKITVWGDTV